MAMINDYWRSMFMATFMNTHHVWSMIIDIAMNIDRLDQWSKVKLYEHRSSMIINHKWHSSRSMIVAMKCRWSYMISVDQWVISWTLSRCNFGFTMQRSFKKKHHMISTNNDMMSVIKLKIDRVLTVLLFTMQLWQLILINHHDWSLIFIFIINHHDGSYHLKCNQM